MKYIALICARGGSKGLPGKNIKILNGKPLIGWSIEIAKQIAQIKRIIVSTDSLEIAETAKEYGAEVPFIRPDELSKDDSPEWLAWQHALDYLSNHDEVVYDGLISIPTTAPLRAVEDVQNCIKEYEKGDVDAVITVSNSHRNPYFNMVMNDNNGFSSLVNVVQKNITRRQDAPEVFDMTTVAYVVSPDFIRNKNSLFEGRLRSVNIPIERALDIDTLLDFRIAECLVKM